MKLPPANSMCRKINGSCMYVSAVIVFLVMQNGGCDGQAKESCELKDGDCPAKCPKNEGSHSSIPLIEINRLCKDGHCKGSFKENADTADAVIRSHSGSNGTDIISFDDTLLGLHTSVLYTCCHTVWQQLRMRGKTVLVNRQHCRRISNATCTASFRGLSIT